MGERLLIWWAAFAVAACKLGPPGHIAHDASKTAEVGKPYKYSADGMVHMTQTPSDSFWFAPCGQDKAIGFEVEREGQVRFTPKEARTYDACVELRTAAGADDTYTFKIVATP